MTPTSTIGHPVPILLFHQLFSQSQQWRCGLPDGRHGVVTGSTSLGDYVISYDVALGCGDRVKAFPAQLRNVGQPRAVPQ